MFLYRVRDHITPAHLLILMPGQQLPKIKPNQQLISPDGLINPLCDAAVQDYNAAESAMQSGFNIGCVIHPSGLMFLDFWLIDDTLPVPKQVILHYLQTTLMIKTGSGGYRACFIHDGIPFDDLILYNRKIVGDLKAGGYMVCPGSWISPSGSLDINGRSDTGAPCVYDTVLNALSPARLDPAKMPAGISVKTGRIIRKQAESSGFPVINESDDFCTTDGVSLAFLQRKLFWAEQALARIASDQPVLVFSAAKDLARLGFDPGTLTRILEKYRSPAIHDKEPAYEAKIAYAAYNKVKSDGRIYRGRIVEEWLREEMNWRLSGKSITRDSSGR